MRHKEKLAHMAVAEIYGSLSYAKRLQVGAVLVKDRNIISFGYNGTPPGWDNCCETERPNRVDETETVLMTKPEVHHAEQNCLSKLLRNGTGSISGTTLFVTHSPCMECAKLVVLSGINNVVYKHDYRSPDGINFLKRSGVSVEKLE